MEKKRKKSHTRAHSYTRRIVRVKAEHMENENYMYVFPKKEVDMKYEEKKCLEILKAAEKKHSTVMYCVWCLI